MKFSIIVPVYNLENYIEDCVESVLAQKFEDLEIILVDDGSTDKSGKICDEYMKKDSRIRVIHQKNIGQAGARNNGIRKAKGEYIIWLDGDDYLPAGAIKTLDKLLKEKGTADIIFHQYQSYYEKKSVLESCQYSLKKIYEEKSIEEIFQYLYDEVKCAGMIGNITIRREYLLDYNLYFKEGIKHEDALWCPIVIMNAKKVLFNNNNFYVYRVDRDGSTMNTHIINNLFDRITVIDVLLLESKKRKYSMKQSNLFEQVCGKIFIGLLTDTNYFSSSNEYKILMKELKKKLWVLQKRKETRYLVVYILCRIFGLKTVSKLLQWKKLK